MDRRTFLAALAALPALPALSAQATRPVPRYRIVTRHPPVSVPGMPGPYPGRRHIEYASTLGLGVYDITAIQHTEITV